MGSWFWWGSAMGLVSRATSVHTALRNCMGDGGGPFEFGNQVLISSHRELLRPKVVVVSVAEKSGQDPRRHGRERHGRGERKQTAGEVSKAD
jgi:hypothetical protein